MSDIIIVPATVAIGIVINIAIVASSYGRISQKVDDVCGRVSKHEEHHPVCQKHDDCFKEVVR